MTLLQSLRLLPLLILLTACLDPQYAAIDRGKMSQIARDVNRIAVSVETRGEDCPDNDTLREILAELKAVHRHLNSDG